MDKVATIRSGMELLSWEYDDDTWRALISRRVAYCRRQGFPADELTPLDWLARDHWDWSGLCGDAHELARFLGVPLWKGL